MAAHLYFSKKLTTLVLSFGVAALFASGSNAYAKPFPADIDVPFPKQVGLWWHYKGRSENMVADNKGQSAPQITLTNRRVKIVDSAVAKLQRLCALHLEETITKSGLGHGKPIVERTTSIALIFDDKQYYLQKSSDADWSALKKQIARGIQIPKPTSNFLEMQLPCSLGSKWGDGPDVARKDNMYCWHVDAVKVVHQPEKYGFKSSKPVKKYSVSMQTGVDTSSRTFLPGVGFIKYSYSHRAGAEKSDEELDTFGDD